MINIQYYTVLGRGIVQFFVLQKTEDIILKLYFIPKLSEKVQQPYSWKNIELFSLSFTDCMPFFADPRL